MEKKRIEVELTVAQKSFLDLEFLFPKMCVNNLHTILFFTDEIKKIEKVYNLVKKMNDVFQLRLSFKDNNYFLYQEVESEYEEIEIYDFTERQIDYEKWIREYQTQQLFVTDSALYNVCMVITPAGEKGLSFLAHHMLHDAFSICLFFKQIIEAVEKEEIGLKRYSFIDYILSRNNSEKNSELVNSYWREKIGQYNADIIFEKNSDSLLGNALEIKISDAFSSNIREYCRDNNVSIFMLFLGTFFLSRSKYFQKTNLEVGVPILNRIGIKEKKTMGLFTNVLPLFVQFNLETSVEDYFVRLREAVNEFYRYRYSSYEEIKKIYEIMWKSEPNLFNTLLSYQKVEFINSDRFNLKWIERYKLVNPLLITIIDCGMGAFLLRYEYRKEIVSEAVVKELSNEFNNSLGKLISSKLDMSLVNVIK